MIKSFIKALLENDTKRATATLRKFFLSEATEKRDADVQELIMLLKRDADSGDIQYLANTIYGYITNIEEFFDREKQYKTLDKNIISQIKRVNIDPGKKRALIAKRQENAEKWNNDIIFYENSIDEIRNMTRRFGAKFEIDYIQMRGGELAITIIDKYDPKSGTNEWLSKIEFTELVTNNNRSTNRERLSVMLVDLERILNNRMNEKDMSLKNAREEWSETISSIISNYNDYIKRDAESVSFEIIDMNLRGWTTISDGELFFEIEYL